MTPCDFLAADQRTRETAFGVKRRLVSAAQPTPPVRQFVGGDPHDLAVLHPYDGRVGLDGDLARHLGSALHGGHGAAQLRIAFQFGCQPALVNMALLWVLVFHGFVPQS